MSSSSARLVCDFCSSTVFTFSACQLALAAEQGFSYTTQKWKAIVDGDEEGCTLCWILREKIVEFNGLARNGSKGPPGDDEDFEVRITYNESQLKVDIKMLHHEHVYPVYCSPDDPAAACISGRNVMWQVGSDRAFELASKRIAECDKSHPSCPKLHPIELPTRVVDCKDLQKLKLVITNGRQGSYVALSYVWGEPQPHSTTTTNLARYQEELDIRLFPKTIRDAITCTHKLKLRYLWIDTLCILQDSAEDKTREIARMHNIYRDAYVTIVAASARRVREGFLEDRDDPMEEDRRLPLWCPDGRLGTISVFDAWSYTPYRNPVDERAWCFQERAMSPRTLLYCVDSLQYQYITDPEMREVGGASIYGQSDRYVPRLPNMMMASRTPPDVISKEDAYALRKAWKDVLATYTRRALTDRSDKLPAISAVAQTFGMWWGPGQYIAGLWEQTLSSDLLWSIQGGSTDHTGYIAPSWSWAATVGQVSLDALRVSDILWEIQVCEAVPATEGFLFGQIKGGKLQVRGIVRSVIWDGEEVELFERRSEAMGYEVEGQNTTQRSSIGPIHLSNPDLRRSSTGIEGNTTAAFPNLVLAQATPSSSASVKPNNRAEIVKPFIKIVKKLVPCVTNRHHTPSEITAGKLVQPLSISALERIQDPGSNLTRTSQADQTATDVYLAGSITPSTLLTSPQTIGEVGEHLKSFQSPEVTSTSPLNEVAVLAAPKVGESRISRCSREEEVLSDSLSNLQLKSADDETTTKEFLRRSGFVHVGYVYLDSKEGAMFEKGFAIVVGSDGDSRLNGLLIMPAGDEGGQAVFRRAGLFVLNGSRNDDPDAPFCDLALWRTTAAQVITII
ncbi:uncharacterized protein FIBRA_01846 [Fibroporia radiculosa]|uniref:Heterokaryon incompatibility domain-containing protein n=1 Tax=Fibroporia radiculosa TaxID=599839 RepID=J4HTZ3_9APHY|nr:uncharacterized protein FIBRA_01846 [Fibroporia radiculosa]CCL99822.1 predicted protein [Fibroporia radiculosa]